MAQSYQAVLGENGENIAPQYNVVNDPDSETPSDNAHKVELRWKRQWTLPHPPRFKAQKERVPNLTKPFVQ